MMYTKEGWDGAALPNEGIAPSPIRIDDRKKLLCSFRTWNMYELRKCKMQYATFEDYTEAFLLNDFFFGNWSRTE